MQDLKITGPLPFRVQVAWADIAAALEIMKRSAAGHFRASPVGNKVVIDCSAQADAAILTNAFPQARLFKVPAHG